MTLSDERKIVGKAISCWGESNLEGLLSCFTDDVVYNVNVDGQQVPYAASAIGKDAVRPRLQLLLDTFEIQAFVPESIIHAAECTRVRILGFYKHRRTGERLDIFPHFHLYVRDGLAYRVDELHDAAYVEAFQRFVTYLEAEAKDGS